MLPGAPRKFAGLDDDAAERGAVAADELRRGVDDDVGAPLDRPAQRRRGERVVDDERDAVRRARRRASAARSATLPAGLPIVSVKMRFGVRSDRGASAGASPPGTSVASMPMRLSVTVNCVTVPP